MNRNTLFTLIAAVDTLLKDIRNKRIAPVYLIHGDEPYYLDRIADELERVIISCHGGQRAECTILSTLRQPTQSFEV